MTRDAASRLKADRAKRDAAFWANLGVLHDALAPYTGEVVTRPAPPKSRQVEAAAAAAFAYARSEGSRVAWSCLLNMSFEEFVKYGRSPPKAALRALAEVFAVYRGGSTMDKAFGLSRRRGGVQDRLAVDEWERTNAQLFACCRERLGMSVEETKAHLSQKLGRGSEATVYRHYQKHRS